MERFVKGDVIVIPFPFPASPAASIIRRWPIRQGVFPKQKPLNLSIQ
jgi:hypothetical protein